MVLACQNGILLKKIKFVRPVVFMIFPTAGRASKYDNPISLFWLSDDVDQKLTCSISFEGQSLGNLMIKLFDHTPFPVISASHGGNHSFVWVINGHVVFRLIHQAI